MAYDPTQPTDSTKIRNLGTVIRPNWQAIEDADSSFKPVGINLDNRTPLVVPNDPVAISETVIPYCKDDVAGDPQLFVIDQSSNVTQLTGIGSIKAWATFNGSTGAVADGYNIASVTRNSTGNYTVAFTTNLASANYAVIGTGQMNAAFTTGGILGYGSPAVGGFNLLVRSLTAVTGADLNPVSFIVIGD